MNNSKDKQNLQQALQAIAEILDPSKRAEAMETESSHADMLRYDNFDMMQLLKVSYRTLMRYRKKGILRFTTIGGKIYYPKNFIAVPEKLPKS